MEVVFTCSSTQYSYCITNIGLQKWFKEHGILNPESLPRHHPLLVKAVREVSKEWNTNLGIFECFGKEYRIIKDANHCEYVQVPDDVKDGWIKVCDLEIEDLEYQLIDAESFNAKRLKDLEIKVITDQIATLQKRLEELNK